MGKAQKRLMQFQPFSLDTYMLRLKELFRVINV